MRVLTEAGAIPRMRAASSELIPSHSTSMNACRCPVGSEAIASASSSRATGPAGWADSAWTVMARSRRARNGQVPQALPVQVHSGAVDIPCWRLHHPHPIPALIDPRHGRLREFLGLALVAREQVQGSYQARVLGVEELLEAHGLHHVPQGRHCTQHLRLASPPAPPLCQSLNPPDRSRGVGGGSAAVHDRLGGRAVVIHPSMLRHPSSRPTAGSYTSVPCRPDRRSRCGRWRGSLTLAVLACC